jgi:amino acid transporter
MLLAFSALSPAFSVYIGGDAVLHLAGTGAAVAFLVGGLTAAILGLLYAEVGAAFPGAGGVYPSLAALLGPLLAFPYIVLLAPIVFPRPPSPHWAWPTTSACWSRARPCCRWPSPVWRRRP